MPFASYCKKCSKKSSRDNDSLAYMIGIDLLSIKGKIAKHYNAVHGETAQPDPFSISWNEDFKKVMFELPQHGDVEHDGLVLPFRGPSVRQFDCDSYTISVITHRDYDECVKSLKDGKRIDIHLYPYKYANNPDWY